MYMDSSCTVILVCNLVCTVKCSFQVVMGKINFESIHPRETFTLSAVVGKGLGTAINWYCSYYF